MSTNQIGATRASQLHVEETVTRKTPRTERAGFGSVLRTGAGVAMLGVEVGGAIVGGPLVGAAIRGVRVGVEASGGGGGGGGTSGGPLGTAGGAAGIAENGARTEQNSMDQMRDMQQQSQEFNLQYLALQEEVQQENRRFSTVSNVLKAKHETAKSAIANIRS